ncbi:MAG: DinG family ATP-dependent helicase YoaA [uncultured Acidimicrobiales bacterium]|uniref:DinG family ATP-dependent helicase YoaA n=1 Tax=uncultured Acidimicrobiales bacterium TaxID=310071 RepID=A0A6J4HRC9_9ACTN|nr:MAG: DinG family ATP-dependent helicase YoaA [uncultured Acidimicrobiales bacterium]
MSTDPGSAARALAKLGGETRPGQIAMAEAVATAVREERALVVQGGTGTGKTWAYLVGALLDGGGRRVVIATATKALQDQLAGKDLPTMVASGLRPDLTWAVLKGRSNYLCRQAASEASREADAPTLAVGPDRSGMGAEVTKLLAWGQQSQTGDRAELDFEPRPAAWSSVSVGSEECPGAQACPSGQSCFAEAAYERAREADVIVVNLHLLGAHVASGGHVLPEHDVVIVDEAHETEDVLSGALGVTLTPGRVGAVARLAPGSALVRHRDSLDRALTPFVGRRLAKGATGEPAVAEALADLAQVVREERSALRGAPDGETADAKARRERAAKALDTLAADVDTVLGAADDFVTWVESSGTQPSLRVAPVDVGVELAKMLWSSATPILTSATIPPGISARLGLTGTAVEIDVGSPFDYRNQSLLYVPRLPDVRHADHEAAAHDELEFLLTAAGGRTLALFTSWRAMRAAKAALDGRLPYTLLAQDDLPKPALIEAFRTDESSCLFATMGFWQGVDVPGDACSQVVIDRLPFARPDDPVAEARRERAGPAAFSVVDIPHAAIRLAQGAGRLIRSATDRGVVAVLDPRLAEASYRPAILGALPPMRRTRDRSDVTAFFA